MRGLTLLLIMLSLVTSAAFGDVLIGRHTVRGTTPEGASYDGDVDISIQGGVYFLRWYLTNGEIYDGRGRLEGDTLTIEWGDTTPVIYKVEPNGVLRGTWGGGRGTDTITPKKETIAQNNIGKDCDFETNDPDRIIKGCSELLDMWKGPTGQKSDSIVPTFFLLRAEAYMDKGEDEKALDDVASALKISPTMPGAYSVRSHIRAHRAEMQLALEDINKAIALTVPPFDPDADDHYFRGVILEKTGDSAGAEASFKQALKIDPSHKQAQERLNADKAALAAKADSLQDCLDWKGVVPDETNAIACTKFIDRTPQHPELAQVHRTRGFFFEFADKLDEAIADYSRAIELDPNKVDYFDRRGLSYQKRGDLELAAADFRKALAIQPDDKLAKQRLEQLSSDRPRECRKGEVISVTAKITSVEEGPFLVVQQTSPGCEIYGVDQVFDMPSNCVQGATVTASGTVDVDEEEEAVVLSDPEEISCQ